MWRWTHSFTRCNHVARFFACDWLVLFWWHHIVFFWNLLFCVRHQLTSVTRDSAAVLVLWDLHIHTCGFDEADSPLRSNTKHRKTSGSVRDSSQHASPSLSHTHTKAHNPKQHDMEGGRRLECSDVDVHGIVVNTQLLFIERESEQKGSGEKTEIWEGERGRTIERERGKG